MEDIASGLHVHSPATLKRYRMLFISAAWWNWLVALVSLFADKEIRSFLGMPPLTNSLNLHLSASCIWLLGIGYYWIARDVSRNHAIAKLGMIGKLAVFAIFLGHLIAGDIPFGLAAPAAIDLIFAVLFLEFLVRMRDAEGNAAGNPADSGV